MPARPIRPTRPTADRVLGRALSGRRALGLSGARMRSARPDLRLHLPQPVLRGEPGALQER